MAPGHHLRTSVGRVSFIVLLGLITAISGAIIANADGAAFADPGITASAEGSVEDFEFAILRSENELSHPDGGVADGESASHDYGEIVDYPLVFPVGGDDFYYSDDQYIGFWACRDGCARTHHAIDIMTDKMTEVYAVADGTVTWLGTRCCSVFLTHDDGWESWYIHLNNDTEGTDDGLGWGIAPGIEIGTHVEAGQLIGWIGDSGNAEDTAPHLHFELYDPADTVVNPYRSLREAEEARGFSCGGHPATRVDTNGDHVVLGTPHDDVIVGTDSADYLNGLDGNDFLCGGGGGDQLTGGTGDDSIWGDEGKDSILGGGGTDLLHGDAGDDDIRGAGGDDSIWGGPGHDSLRGGYGNDYLTGEDGNDSIRGGPGNDRLYGQHGRDLLHPDEGDDLVMGGRGQDSIFSAAGHNTLRGGVGQDTVLYSSAGDPVVVDLSAGTAVGEGDDLLRRVERVQGSEFDDVIRGDDQANVLFGLAGNDILLGDGGADMVYGDAGDDDLRGGPGDDSLFGGDGTDGATGGTGTDSCSAESVLRCEF